MELGESVSVDMIVDEKHDETTCAFCSSTEAPKELTNDLTDHHDEDAEAETGDKAETYKFKNDAGKLGIALGGKPSPKELFFGDKCFEAAVAAHHLIPGNASLKNSFLFESEEYLWADGKAKGNIGYDINCAENGVWSPGNYGVRPWGAHGSVFKSKNGIEPKEFAYAAMDAWGTQFHDAHEKYSVFVRDALDKLYEKLDAKHDIWCPEAKKKDKNPEERDPLYVIVSRLNTISFRMKRMLVFPTTNWKRNIFTSRFAESYMDEKSHVHKAIDHI